MSSSAARVLSIATQEAERRVETALARLPKWTPEERSRYCEEMPDHPLFQKNMSKVEEQESEVVQALKKSEYDELDTPINLANEAKEKGNAAFARGVQFHGMAIKHWLDGVQHARMAAEQAGDSDAGSGSGSGSGSSSAARRAARALESTLHSNLGAVWLHRGKLITCIDACGEALRLNPGNVKAAFRGARAALTLGRAAAALELCEVGATAAAEEDEAAEAKAKAKAKAEAKAMAREAEAEALAASEAAAAAAKAGGAGGGVSRGASSGHSSKPSPSPGPSPAPAPAVKAAAAFAPLIAEARKALAVQEAHAAATVAAAQERAARLAGVRAACEERGIKVGPPLFSGMKRTAADPYVDSGTGELRWPLLLLYPEHGASDYLEDVGETDAVGDVLSRVLPDDGGGGGGGAAPPPPWDRRGEYRASNCDVFFKSNPCRPLASLSEAWTQAALESPPEEHWGDVRWVRVPAASPLLLPLVQPTYVVADVPVLYVVARSSGFYAAMRAGAKGGEFATLRVPDLAPPADD